MTLTVLRNQKSRTATVPLLTWAPAHESVMVNFVPRTVAALLLCRLRQARQAAQNALRSMSAVLQPIAEFRNERGVGRGVNRAQPGTCPPSTADGSADQGGRSGPTLRA